MTDVFTREKRSEVMSKIRSSGTRPEVTVAAMLAKTRLKVEEQAAWLPGRPDFIVRSKKIAVFVHGCFWHQHEACGAARRSSGLKRRDEFWRVKFENNRLRDARAVRRLRKNGWRILTIWECMVSMWLLVLNTLVFSETDQ